MSISLGELDVARRKTKQALVNAEKRQREARKSGADHDTRQALAQAVEEARQKHQFATEDYDEGVLIHAAQQREAKKKEGQAIVAQAKDKFSALVNAAGEIDTHVQTLGRKVRSFVDSFHAARGDFIIGNQMILGDPSDPTFLSYATADFDIVFEALAAQADLIQNRFTSDLAAITLREHTQQKAQSICSLILENAFRAPAPQNDEGV